jgi:uncharacterized protein YndB with AHSA1/START domain
MKPITQERTIAASPSAVFSVLADLDQAKEWMPAVQEIRRLSDGKLEKGTRWIETRATKRGPFVATVEVTEYEPDRALALRAENKRARIEFRFELAPEGEGTKVRTESKGRLKGLLRPLSGRLAKDMQASDGDILERLDVQVAKASKGTKARAAARAAPAAKGKAVTGKATTPKAAASKHAKAKAAKGKA